jgi:nucleoside-diphosphate-sugar epimerase
MKVLLTGAFGNVGSSTLREMVRRDHTIRCFDLKTKANQKTARSFGDRIEVVWGDIMRQDDVMRAVADRDLIIHLAAIIPPMSEAKPEMAREVNVGGTRNVLTAAKSLSRRPKFIYASTVSLFGLTQDQPAPRTVDDPIRPTDNYTHHKAECEGMIKESGLGWAVLRFGAVLSLAVLGSIDPLMFEVPLNNRMEFVHTYDVGLALANAVSSDEIWGKVLLIGGGSKCQIHQRDILKGALEGMGIGMLPEEAFTSKPFYVDWMDTSESQRLLKYQRHTYDDYVRHVSALLGYRRYFIRLLRPLIRSMMLNQSPYWRALKNSSRKPVR